MNEELTDVRTQITEELLPYVNNCISGAEGSHYQSYSTIGNKVDTVLLKLDEAIKSDVIGRQLAVIEDIIENPDYTNPEGMVRKLKEALKDTEKTHDS